MEARVEIITPEKAKEYLKCNVMNRSLSEERVDYYTRLMKDGLWEANGEAVQFLEGGVLGNGQHRLSAIVKSGVSIEMVIVTNVRKKAFSTYDGGKNRTVSDLFSIYGVESNAACSSIVGKYCFLNISNSGTILMNEANRSGFGKNVLRGLKRLSNEEVYQVYSKNPEIFSRITQHAKRCNNRLNILSTTDMGGVMAYLVIDKKHDIEFVIGFYDMLTDMSNQTNVTINTLREKLYKDKIDTKKMTPLYKSQIFIKAWNAYATGKELTRLAWNEEKEGRLKFI